MISGCLELGRMRIWDNRDRWAGFSLVDNKYSDYI